MGCCPCAQRPQRPAAVAVFGFSPVPVLSTNLVVGSAPSDRAGSAAALSETGGELGAALGVAVMGSIVIAVYRSGVAGDLPPGVAPETGDSLNAALAVADRLPPALAAQVVDAARTAFTQGLNAVAVVGIALLVALAGPALATLRERAPSH